MSGAAAGAAGGSDSSPIFVAGRWETSRDPFEVRAAGGGETVGVTYRADADQYERAVTAAVQAFEVTRRLASFERSAILRRVAAGMEGQREELARSLALEAGKPIDDARIEVDRTALAFRISAEEAERLGGEVMPLDLIESSRHRWGITRRMPVGPVAAISPFNVPLSLAAHKLGPALAAGNTIVLKPPSQVPHTLLRLAGILQEAGVPEGSVSVLPMARDMGDRMVEDDRFRVLSFTGSPEVGWDMRSRAGSKHVALELGGNAGLIVDETADVSRAVSRTVRGAFKHAGQLCISVQRAFVHESVWDEFVGGLAEGAAKLAVGHPLDESVDLGPMVSIEAADRFMEWLDEAVALGGSVVEGGEREGAYVRPTVVEGVPPHARLCAEEAFAPVVVVSPFTRFGDALERCNDSRYGLQAGVFTRDLSRAWAAFENLDVGGVVIDDVPTFRMDNMPYGGSKRSGSGREGIRWAMEHMTELRLMVVGSDSSDLTDGARNEA